MKIMVRILLLAGLLSGTTWHQGYTEKNNDEESEVRPYAKTGRDEGDAGAYDYVFNKDFKVKGKLKQEAIDSAHKMFGVPEDYELVTVRDNKEAQDLRYGDLVRIWSIEVEGYLHTHSLNYFHEESSNQQQVTIFAENPDRNRDRKSIDKDATWWQVEGPQKENNKKETKVSIAGRVNLDEKVSFFAFGYNGYTLHSHSFQEHRKVSPAEKEKNMQKQEVTCYNKRDENDNWLFKKSVEANPLQKCDLGTKFALRHASSQWFLRANKDMLFNVRGNKDLNANSDGDMQAMRAFSDDKADYQHEVAAVKNRDNPRTTFKIALIARKIVKQSKKAFAQEYLNQFEEDQLYTISAVIGEEKRLLCQMGERLFARGSMPKSKDDPRIDETIEYRTLFKIRTDKNDGDGVLGIEAANYKDKRGNLLQRHREKKLNQTKWKSRVQFQNKNFDSFERWYPRDADNGAIYLDHKPTKAYLTVKEETLDVVYPNLEGAKTRIKPGTVEASDDKKTKFIIKPFQPRSERKERRKNNNKNNNVDETNEVDEEDEEETEE